MSEELIEGTGAVEAKLAEAGVDTVRRHSFSEAPEAAPEVGTPAEVVDEGQPRNELGQFVGAEQPEEVPSEPQAQTGDPAVAAFLSKYGGDVDKALAGAVHLQRKAGEQSNELGELRRMVDELSSLRETIAADAQARQQYQAPIDQATVDWYDQQILEGNGKAALEWARQQGNELLLQRGLSTWKQVDPYEAAAYRQDLYFSQLRQEMEQQKQASQQLPVDANVHMALSNVRSQHPEFVNYDDALGDTLAKYPFMQEALVGASQSGDRAKLEGAIETLYALAQRDTLASIALTGNTPETTATSSEVAEPTTSETREPAPEPSPLDAWRDEFRQMAERERKGVWVAD